MKLDMTYCIQFVKAWIIASLTAFVLASILHTQMVLLGLINIDITIGVSAWLRTTFEDIWGLFPTYAPVIALALFLAMLVVVFFTKFIATPKVLGFIGGAAAMLTVLLTMQPIMDITLIAGAREPLGFALQCLSGAIGGWVFAKIFYR